MSKYITCTECSLVLIVLTDATSHGCFFLAINDHISDTSAYGHMFWIFPNWFFPKVPNEYIQSPTEKEHDFRDEDDGIWFWAFITP